MNGKNWDGQVDGRMDECVWNECKGGNRMDWQKATRRMNGVSGEQLTGLCPHHDLLKAEQHCRL